jgi:hypothetical protein
MSGAHERDSGGQADKAKARATNYTRPKPFPSLRLLSLPLNQLDNLGKDSSFSLDLFPHQ